MHVLGLFWIVQVEIENFGFFEISTNKCGWTLRRWFGLSILWFCSKEYRLLYRSLAPKTDHKWTKYGPNSNSFISSIILIWPHFRNIGQFLMYIRLEHIWWIERETVTRNHFGSILMILDQKSFMKIHWNSLKSMKCRFWQNKILHRSSEIK